ncbi:MAG: Cohesin domain protein [candidate division BRC1 bacterium ADurb.BinA364]|nr:MAG: Cohesin domain protein [candidate division BRC1 bacterium ADurb.BinA364]
MPLSGRTSVARRRGGETRTGWRCALWALAAWMLAGGWSLAQTGDADPTPGASGSSGLRNSRIRTGLASSSSSLSASRNSSSSGRIGSADESQGGSAYSGSRSSSLSRRSRGSEPDPRDVDPFSFFRSETPGASVQPSPPAGARAAEAPSVTTKKEAAPAALSRSAAGKASAAKGMSLQNLPRMQTLYIRPGSAAFAVGETFTTSIMLANPGMKAFDTYRLILRYDPRVMAPIGVVKGTAGARGEQSEDFYARDLRSEGLLAIECQNTTLPTASLAELARLQWQAVGPSAMASLEFASNGGQASGVFRDGQSILGEPMLDTDGLVGASFQIAALPPDPMAADAPLTEDLEIGNYARAFGAGTNAKVGLRLIGPTAAVKPGDPFFVDVALENPLGARLDALTLIIEFDPDALQVIDYDENNWISLGLNIHDGAYRERYPFEFHIRNQAYNSLGEIHYMVGSLRPDAVYPSGKLASILFVARRTSGQTEVRFRESKESIDLGVEAAYLGQSVLAEQNGLFGATIRIAP